MSAQFFGRSGKVLYGAFSIVGMASQSHNVNKGIPDDRVARSKHLSSFKLRRYCLVATFISVRKQVTPADSEAVCQTKFESNSFNNRIVPTILVYISVLYGPVLTI